MGDFVKQCQRAVRRTGIGTFLELPRIDDSDGYTLFRPRDSYEIGGFNHPRISAVTARIPFLGGIFFDSKSLFFQTTDKIHAKIPMTIKKERTPWPRPALPG